MLELYKHRQNDFLGQLVTIQPLFRSTCNKSLRHIYGVQHPINDRIDPHGRLKLLENCVFCHFQKSGRIMRIETLYKKINFESAKDMGNTSFRHLILAHNISKQILNKIASKIFKISSYKGYFRFAKIANNDRRNYSLYSIEECIQLIPKHIQSFSLQ